jgi:hypothetical protein
MFGPLTAVHVADVFVHEMSASGNHLFSRPLDHDHLDAIGLTGRLGSWKTVCRALYNSKVLERMQ